MCNFIKCSLQGYQRVVGSRDGHDQWLAYKALGRALHPIMDFTSAAHEGWQAWDHPCLDPARALQRGSLPYLIKDVKDVKDLTPGLLAQTLHTIKAILSDRAYDRAARDL